MTAHELASPDVIIDATDAVGEGPVIDPRTGALVRVDIVAGGLHEVDLATGRSTSLIVPTLLGAVAPRSSHPGFAAAVSDGFGVIVDGELTVIDRCLPEPDLRMNDAKSDARGRLWAGSCALDFQPGRGRLHRWDGDTPSVIAATGRVLPNGLGWSPDSRRMYLADSMTHEVLVADFDLDGGAVGEFRPWVRVESGLPDGLAVDQDGAVWVAVWGGSEVLRFAPDGELVARVPMPVSQPSSCTIAADGTLYITSARAGLSEEALLLEPRAGSVFALAVGVPGVPIAPMEV
ncbi:MAG: SMP-30/gluconolactonase/LRE family protein [Microcella sp.]